MYRYAWRTDRIRAKKCGVEVTVWWCERKGKKHGFCEASEGPTERRLVDAFGSMLFKG